MSELDDIKNEIALTVWCMVGVHVGKMNPECYPEERLRERLREKLAILELRATNYERGVLTRQWIADEMEALMRAGSPKVEWGASA